MEKYPKIDFAIILGVNIISQGFLLILTGTFWDDWIYYYHDKVGLWNQFMEAGRPSSAYWIEAVWNLPNYGYRWIVFFMFAFTSILFYLILNNTGMFEREDALGISILYTIFPINDCRVILCDVVYTVGLLSFFIGCYILVRWFKRENTNRRIIFRILALLFLGYSFVINSLLFFYVIILLYLFFMEYQKKKKISTACSQMFKYIDFLLLPILFFMGKQILFPVYGRYENYNIITIQSLVDGILQLPIVTYKQLIETWISCFSFWVPNRAMDLLTRIIIIYAVVKIVLHIIRKKSISNVFDGSFQNYNFLKALFGIVIFGIGLYPYIVIRGTRTVGLVGVSSRDSMLLGLGLAIFIYYFLKSLVKRNIVRNIFYSIICVSCIVSCNIHYLNYQRDAYWQDALMAEFRLNDEIRQAENILFLSDDSSGIYGTRFYSLNGNASVAYGNQSRLFLNGYADLELLTNERSILVDSKGYLMNDYNAENDELDGIAVYNCDISYSDCIRLKKLEMMNKSAYQSIVGQIGTLTYYPVKSIEAIALLEGYDY